MALQNSGPISLQDIYLELGYPIKHPNSNIASSEARSLAGVPTGSINFADFYGAEVYVNLSLDPSNPNSVINAEFSSTVDTTIALNSIGGRAPYTWTFTRSSGYASTVIANGNDGTATFRATGIPRSRSRTTTYTITVSDGTTSDTGIINISFRNAIDDGGDGPIPDENET